MRMGRVGFSEGGLAVSGGTYGDDGTAGEEDTRALWAF